MFIKRKCLAFFLIAFLLIGCSRIVYTVAIHRDPILKPAIGSKTYALIVVSEDPFKKIVEKKILNLIRKSLNERGWREVLSEEAKYLFGVNFEIMSTQHVVSEGVSTYYDPEGKAHVSGGGGGSYTAFQRTVQVVAFSRDSEVVWTADCFSEGSTPDVFFAAKYMVPFAIKKFPEEGTWKKKKITSFTSFF